MKCICNDHAACITNIDNESYCITDGGGKCYYAQSLKFNSYPASVHSQIDQESQYFDSYGCLSHSDAIFSCKITDSFSPFSQNIHCCDSEDFCNAYLTKIPINDKKKDILAKIISNNQANIDKDYYPHIIDERLKFLDILEFFSKHEGSEKQPESKSLSIESAQTLVTLLALIGAIFVIFFLIFLFTFMKIYQRRFKKKKSSPFLWMNNEEENSLKKNYQSLPKFNLFKDEFLSQDQTFNHNNIHLGPLIDTGTFYNSFQGYYNEEVTSVKMFNTQKIDSILAWQRRTLINREKLLRHQNIHVTFTTQSFHDTIGLNLLTIESLASFGSLDHVMRNYSLDTSIFKSLEIIQVIRYRVIHGILSAISYFHTEISGTRGKLAMSHRSISPRVFYFTSNWSICLGGFSKAIVPLPLKEKLPANMTELHQRYQEHVTLMESLRNVAIGEAHIDSLLSYPLWFPISCEVDENWRYTPPEVVLERMDVFNFYQHQLADIYSVSLVLWEVCRWLEGKPFQEVFSEEFEKNAKTSKKIKTDKELVKVMYTENVNTRPVIEHDSATTVKDLSLLTRRVLRSLPQCWSKVPDSRISIHRMIGDIFPVQGEKI